MKVDYKNWVPKGLIFAVAAALVVMATIGIIIKYIFQVNERTLFRNFRQLSFDPHMHMPFATSAGCSGDINDSLY